MRKTCSIWSALLLLAGGCAFFSGSIEEQLPKLRDKLPETSRVYLANPLNPNGGFLYTRNGNLVVNEFRRAFERRGIAVTAAARRGVERSSVRAEAKTNDCTVAVFSEILSWSYGDAGFSGFGGRDEVVLSVMLMNPATERVTTRARLTIANGIGKSAVGGNDSPGEVVAPIIQKYVDSLFPEKKAP